LLAISALFTMSYSAFLAVLHARLRDGAGEGAAEAFA
jgi:Mg2+/Co2+ transporter CorB